MATISNTPRPGYVWDSTDNVWYPIGVGGHGHTDYITQATAINPTLLTTTGDTIYASAANTPTRRAIGTTGQVLTVAGGIPTWATPSASAINTGYTYTGGAEGTTGTTYAGLTTATATTVTTGTKALVTVTAYIYNNSNSATCHGFVGYAISGATTVAASDQYASQAWINTTAANSTNGFSFSSTFLVTGLTAGSNIFTMQYKTGTSESAGFYRRSISVVDLGS